MLSDRRNRRRLLAGIHRQTVLTTAGRRRKVVAAELVEGQRMKGKGSQNHELRGCQPRSLKDPLQRSQVDQPALTRVSPNSWLDHRRRVYSSDSQTPMMKSERSSVAQWWRSSPLDTAPPRLMISPCALSYASVSFWI
jgi:hypothetical protein